MRWEGAQSVGRAIYDSPSIRALTTAPSNGNEMVGTSNRIFFHNDVSAISAADVLWKRVLRGTIKEISDP